MLKWVFCVALVAGGVGRAEETCAQQTARLQKQVKIVASFLAKSSRVMKTESDDPMEMVKEFVHDEYRGESDDTHFVRRDGVPGDVAGLTTTRAAIAAIMDNQATWYLPAENSKEANKALQADLRAAAIELTGQGLVFGFDGTAQGWGGSPATNLLVLDKECQRVHVLFLGITHD